jgi:serralysin
MAFFIGNGLNNIANAPGGVLAGFVGGNLAQLQDGLGDTILGLGGNDSIVAGNGNDVINGGSGNDFIDGRFGLDRMDGGTGIDTMDVSFFAGSYVWNMATGVTNFSAAGEFAFNFENARTGAGADSITGNAANNSISLGAGNDFASGGFGNDQVFGGLGNDNLFGGNGNDSLFGDAGNDNLNGGLGNDLMVGGLGRDVMTGGGGFDRFDFNSVGESLPGFFSRDVITDFAGNGIFAGDVIDVSTIDANVFLLGNQAFNFIGALPFFAPGQLRYAGGVLQGSTDFDLASEFEIQLTGAPAVTIFDLAL